MELDLVDNLSAVQKAPVKSREDGKEIAKMHVLLVEDDPVIGRALVKGFKESGHECDWYTDGRSGRDAALSQQADVLILDYLLPEMSGHEVLTEVRQKGILTPVIMLTALGSVEGRIAGLNAGADDYLAKPFEFAELLARINAILRRSGHRPSPVLQSGNLSLDLTTRRVMRGDNEIELTPIEFSLLEMLMRFAGQVVTRKMLCEHVWGFHWEGTTNVIEVHINRLRGKLNQGTNDVSIIKTIRGRGYSIAAGE